MNERVIISSSKYLTKLQYKFSPLNLYSAFWEKFVLDLTPLQYNLWIFTYRRLQDHKSVVESLYLLIKQKQKTILKITFGKIFQNIVSTVSRVKYWNLQQKYWRKIRQKRFLKIGVDVLKEQENFTTNSINKRD